MINRVGVNKGDNNVVFNGNINKFRLSKPVFQKLTQKVGIEVGAVSLGMLSNQSQPLVGALFGHLAKSIFELEYVEHKLKPSTVEEFAKVISDYPFNGLLRLVAWGNKVSKMPKPKN